jgi:PAS domain S-box-containing protein
MTASNRTASRQRAQKPNSELENKLEQTQKELDQARQKAGNLDNLPTPIVAIDRDFTVTYVNAAGASVLGSTPEQVIGKKCYSLFRTPHCQTPECRCAQAMQKGQTCTGETVADPGGLNLPIQYTGAPIKDASGQVGGGLEYVVDITEIKKAQEIAKKVATYQESEVEKVSGTLAKVADGDLTADYAVADPDDDTQLVAQAFDGIAKALNATVRSLNGVIGQMTESAAQFNEGSRVIAESSQTLASGAQEQSSSVEQITASIEELSRSVEGVKENSHEADKVSKDTNQLAEQGGQAVRKSAEAMERIKASSDQIAEIIQVISENRTISAKRLESCWPADCRPRRPRGSADAWTAWSPRSGSAWKRRTGSRSRLPRGSQAIRSRRSAPARVSSLPR